MVAAMMDPVVVDDDTLAIDAIEEVGPGGHFFGVGHTQDRYRTAFYRPLVSDWRNYESWAEAGRPEAAAKAMELAAAFLAAYEPPPMDPSRREELDEFVARRVAEGGVATDF
jgi:trimethylamine--corrinoid protein Co-methyltransferase